MARKLILIERKKPRSAHDMWLARADQARRVAAMLLEQDAALAESYAAECEAEAAGLIEERFASRAA